MRQSISWTLVVLAFGFGFVSVVNGQEGRPVGERPEASTRRTQPAEPESPATRGAPAQGNQAAAPRLVKVSGVLTEFVRNPESSSVEITFAVYKDEMGGEALWTETQSVEVDKEARYTVLLGAAQADGVPMELFPAGEPRWLGVEIRGQAPQSRTLFVSVPYALKALDAEKLSGKSLSDFVLSDSLGEQVRQVIQAQGQSTGQSTLAGAQQKQTGTSSKTTPQTTSAGPMFPPSTFSGTNSTQIVRVQQNGTGNGLVASTPSSTGASALVGLATSTSTSNSVFQNGVYGQNDGSGAGVAGIATNPSVGVGVYGQGASFAGVFGQTFNPNTNGVAGNANATTGFSVGVSGLSASTSGAGVFGNAIATSGTANGVQGQTASPQGAGVGGFANASSGFTTGVSGDASASPNGTGVFGLASQQVGVGGLATAPSGSPAYGVWGDSLSTSGIGVAGYEDATSGFTNGVFGQSVSPNGIGVFGANNSATGGSGVLGVANATSGNANGVFGVTDSPGGNGVFGAAVATSGNANGVLGMTSAPTGYAVWGAYGFGSTSGFGVGVKGSIEAGAANGGVAGQFFNVPGQGLLLQGISGLKGEVFSVDANGNLQMSGNLTVSGTKSSTAMLKDGRVVALYAVESPENWFEDFGSAELRDGVAWVPLDTSFAQAVNAAVNYHVFLTADGDSNGLYVARKTSAGFEVREHGGGNSNLSFDYRIVARRRGYETLRMAEVREDPKIIELSRKLLRESTNTEILKGVAAVRIPPSGPKPTVRPMPARPNVPEVPRPIVPQAPKVNVPQTPKGSVPQTR